MAWAMEHETKQLELDGNVLVLRREKTKNLSPPPKKNTTG